MPLKMGRKIIDVMEGEPNPMLTQEGTDIYVLRLPLPSSFKIRILFIGDVGMSIQGTMDNLHWFDIEED